MQVIRNLYRVEDDLIQHLTKLCEGGAATIDAGRVRTLLTLIERLRVEAEQGPSLAAIVAGLAAQVTVLSPQGIAELHAAIDELSGITNEVAFHQAQGRLGLALTRRVANLT